MITLIGVEVRRILARRLVRVAGLLIFAAVLFAGVITFIRARTVDVSGLREVFLGTSGPLIVLMVVLGASFAGAEWHAGTITTLLTWEPRRGRVVLAKIVAAALFAFVTAAGVQALLAGSLLPAAASKGVGASLDAEWFRLIGAVILRGATMAALASVLGFSIASLGRNTAAAVGVLFAYVAVAEPLVRGLRPAWQGWLLSENIASFVSGEAVFFPARPLTAVGLTVLAYAAVLSAAAATAFRARDVT